MSDIPNFKNLDDESKFYDIFDEKLIQYKYVMDKVRELMFDGRGSGSYMNIPGSMLEVIYKITDKVLYDSVDQFKNLKPEYKDDFDNVFVPRNELRNTIKEAIVELQSTDSDFIKFTLGDK